MEQERPSVRKVDCCSNPSIFVGSGPVLEAVDPGEAVEQESTRHAESHPERRALGLEQQEFSSPLGGDEGESREHGLRVEARPTTASCELVDEDTGDRSVEGTFCKTAVVLDLEDLRHWRNGTGLRDLDPRSR